MENTKNVFISKNEIFDKVHNLADEKICFIFGAGASYGYINNSEYFLPPIVSDLFKEENEVVKEIINRPQHKFILRQKYHFVDILDRYDNDLEKYLSHLYKIDSKDDTFSNLLLYLYDIYFLVSSNINENKNNYRSLINLLFDLRKKSTWSCISFNYDTILEQSYISLERDRLRNFENLKSYTGSDPKIIKIHGGVNFHYKFEEKGGLQKRIGKEIFGYMMRGKQKENNISILPPKSDTPPFHSKSRRFNATIRLHEDFSKYSFPLMMVPIHGTKRPENPFFADMLNEAKREIETSTLIVAIGYNFGDELFSKEIKKIDLSKKELILVGSKGLLSNPETHRGITNVSNFWKKENIKIFEGNGFADFIRSIFKKDQSSS